MENQNAVHIVDSSPGRAARTRMAYLAAGFAFLALFLVLMSWALLERGGSPVKRSNQLLLASPLALFVALECLLAGRRKVRDRILAVELGDDSFTVRNALSRPWSAGYGEIAGVLLRYRGGYAHYDHMNLVLTLKNGSSYWLGDCPGETLDVLAGELRRRSAAPGTPGEDREYRLRQRRRTGRIAAGIMALAALVLLGRAVQMEMYFAGERRLEREGVLIEARTGVIIPRRRDVYITYVFLSPVPVRHRVIRGSARLPYSEFGRLRGMQNPTVSIRYLDSDPGINHAVAGLPRYSRSSRIATWGGLFLFLALMWYPLSGRDVIFLRGKLRLVGKNTLAEDSLPGCQGGK